MHAKKSPTAAELKLLLIARQETAYSGQAKLRARLNEALKNPTAEENPQHAALGERLRNLACDVAVSSLMLKPHTLPLISIQDFEPYIPSLVDGLAQANDLQPTEDERKTYEVLMKMMFGNFMEMTNNVMMPPGSNPYNETWRWIWVILDISTERDIPPTKLLPLEEVRDEITRRMFSKEEYIYLCKKDVGQYMDDDTLINMFLQPMLDSEENEEERRDMEAFLRPLLNERLKKSKVVVEAYIAKETARIYGA